MTITSRTEFQVINRRGTIICTFDGIDARKRAIARAKSRDMRLAHGDLDVAEVTFTTTSRRVYRAKTVAAPKCAPDFDLAIPGMPA
jgi:hypothetical protein